MSKESKTLKAADYPQWLKDQYNQTLKEVNGDAAQYLNEYGHGEWYEIETPSLKHITKELKEILFADPDETISLDQDGNEGNGVNAISTAKQEAVNEILKYAFTKYDKDMFAPEDQLTVVSNAMFNVHYDIWFSVCKKTATANRDLIDLKKKCWGILESNTPVDVYNIVKSKPDFMKSVSSFDCVWLKNCIRVVLIMEQSGVPIEDKLQSRNDLTTCRQKDNEDVHMFFKRLDEKVKTIVTTFTLDRIDPMHHPLKNEDFAAIFIKGLNYKIHGEFVSNVRNNYLNRVQPYPINLTEAYHRCVNFKPTKSNGTTISNSNIKPNAFLAATKSKDQGNANTNKRDNKSSNTPAYDRGQAQRDASEMRDGALVWKNTGKRVVCRNCEKNHVTADCKSDPKPKSQPNKSDTETKEQRDKRLLAEVEAEKEEKTQKKKNSVFMTFVKPNAFKSGFRGVNKNSLLLDNECSKSVFSNKRLFLPGTIKRLPEPVYMNGIGGQEEVLYEGDTKYFGKVLWNPNCPCQILSEYEVGKRYRIEYKSTQYYKVHLEKDLVLTFKANDETRMYLYQLTEDDISNQEDPTMPDLVEDSDSDSDDDDEDNYFCTAAHNVAINSESQNAFITISEMEKQYDKQQVNRAKEALELQGKLGYASDRDVHEVISHGAAINLPVTNSDFHTARKIYGPSVAILKGKTRHRPPEVYHDNKVVVQEDVNQELHSDLFFVNKIPFLMSVVVPLDYVMVNELRGRSSAILIQMFTKHVTAVNLEKFVVTKIIIDGEGAIAKIKDELERSLQLKVHPSPSKVPKTERKIETLKGRVRSVVMSLPFVLCKILVVMCVLWCVSRLNMVPSKARPNKVSAHEALTGRKLDYKRDLKYKFGDLVEIPVLHTSNSTDEARTHTAIAVASTGNSNGDFKFFKPYTGKFVSRSTSNSVLPFSDGIISTLNFLAYRDGLCDKLFKKSMPTFALRFPDNPDEVIIPPDEIDEDDELLHATLEIPMRENIPISNDAPILNVELPDGAIIDHDDDISVNSTPNDNPVVELRGADHDNFNNLPAVYRSNFHKRYPVRSKYAFTAGMFTRRQAEKQFGEQAIKAKIKEILQLKDLDFGYPIQWLTLSRQQRKSLVRSHIIYQPKYDPDTGAFIKLKARFVANGSTQAREIYDDVASPTVSTHAVFINAAIAAAESRIVKTVDIPGAYLNADMSGEEVLMRIDKEDAIYLVMMKPEYKEFLLPDGSLVVKLTKALYGCIESAKLWYQEISKTLIAAGYEANKKDICVFNKKVDGVQCTITLHVDDLMITSKNEKLIDELTAILKKKYERDDAPIVVNEGKIHKYLGMTFDFSIKGKVFITMKQYIKDLILFCNVTGTAVTPALENLYQISDSPLLNSDQKEYFHTTVAKILYLAKRVRPDLLTTIGFLTKRVKTPTEQDLEKLNRLIKYINGTPELGLILTPDKNLSIFSHIDASFAIHHDLKSQTGAAITLGTGITYAKSSTQQLNSKSSTEAELIALTDASCHVIWVRDYLICQGYNIGPATIYQDNMSTMALVKKGYSTASNTRHINIRYFFIKDRVDNEELKIEYLPTDEMIADFFTKPLQGESFRRLRDKILGIVKDEVNSFVACL